MASTKETEKKEKDIVEKKKTTAKKPTTKKKTTTKEVVEKKNTTSTKKGSTEKMEKKENTETNKKTGTAKKKTTASSTTKKSNTKKVDSLDEKKKKKANNTKKKEEKEIPIKEIVDDKKEDKVVIEEEKEEILVEVTKKEELIKIEEIKNTIKNKKKIPKEEAKKMNKVIHRNIAIAIGIVIYFLFLNLGYINIKNEIFVTDLKVFSMCILLLGIALLELAYKKDSGEIAIHGIEMIVLTIASTSLIYVDLMLSSKFVIISTTISFVFAIYYTIKSVVTYHKKRKTYFVNDMKEMIKEEEE